MNRRNIISLFLLFILPMTSFGAQASQNAFRPPAVPLVAVDPYFSIWSPADQLTDAPTIHWTGKPYRLNSTLSVDGTLYRLMGTEPAEAPALPQIDVTIMPCIVTYHFEGAGIAATLSFTTPLLPEDLMVFSRPVTYLTWNIYATDGREHDIVIHYDNRAELAVNDPAVERITCSRERLGDMEVLKAGSVDQAVLGMKGDNVRINWGYQYVAVPDSQQGDIAILTEDGQVVPDDNFKNGPASTKLSVTFTLDKVGVTQAKRWLILAYDDIYSVQFFFENLKSFWKKDGAEIADLLAVSAVEYDSLQKRCSAFDAELTGDMEKAGGPKYALLGALAYRQSLAASKVVADANGQPLFFCKENTSNGCMGTVDVFYPQSPLPLLISPSLAKAMLIPILEYSNSPGWRWPNAPHDIGTWPLGNGQAYGGFKSDGKMPVEETGNMLLLTAAVAQIEGNADFALKYWPLLTRWAEYLKTKGFDPENQLCTDDFAGHLAHNANLSIKSICALGAYGKLSTMTGDVATGEAYLNLARRYAQEWIKAADDGDHFRLAFDQAGTWSLKYNLVWDKILDMNLFPEEVTTKEMDFYKKNLDTYGLPLDGRKHKAPGERMAYWSKTDWAFWTACLTGKQEDFETITNPAYAFFNAAERRVGLADLYFTDKADTALMHSRPVIGGIFIKLLYDRDVWTKWAARDITKANGPWAPLPEREIKTIVPPDSVLWRYTMEKPGAEWQRPDFNDTNWQQGQGGFGSEGTPGIALHTKWNTPDIWLRSTISIPEGEYSDLQIYLFHDERISVYIDNVLAVRATGYTTDYVPTPTRPSVTLSPGTHLFAVHCHQETGGQGVDLGIVDIIRKAR